MISSETFVPMDFFKKEAYTGSYEGMRYRVGKENDAFQAVVYPQPFSFDVTSKEDKTMESFPFTIEGRQQVIAWLNHQYETKKGIWDKVKRK